MDSAVAVTGCHSLGLERYSCEFDVLVVTDEKRSPTSLRIGETFIDLVFASEKEILEPANPEHALSLAQAKPVRDASLVLSTSSAANAATMSESALKASRTRLASSLKIIGRAEDALTGGAVSEADFWLLASSYEFAYAWLLSKEVLPAPSHLLSQLREASKGAAQSFAGFTSGAGLESAGRAGCGARLEALTVLHDLLRGRQQQPLAASAWPNVKTEILVGKAKELITRMELAECYSFLGQELVDDMLALLRASPKVTFASLTSGEEKLLGERLIRQLGLARTRKAVQTGIEALKPQVSALAKGV